MKRVALAWTGASGMGYGLRLLQCLLAADCQVQLVYSQAAQWVAKQELDLVLSSRPQEALALLRERCPGGELLVYGREDWNAPLASGSNPPQAMAICPCSAGTLAAVAAGFANNLIHRAAGVMLKERRKLILVLRETPLSTIHLENMLRLSQAGAVLLPANPGFYHRPASVEQVIDFVVARVLDQLDVPQQLITPWGEERLSDD